MAAQITHNGIKYVATNKCGTLKAGMFDIFVVQQLADDVEQTHRIAKVLVKHKGGIQPQTLTIEMEDEGARIITSLVAGKTLGWSDLADAAFHWVTLIQDGLEV